VDKLREIYDSRISGLKRQLEEEASRRAEAEEGFDQRLGEEVQKAVEREAHKYRREVERLESEMAEAKTRSEEDLSLLEARLLDATAEISKLQKKEAEHRNNTKRTVQEKHALERELLSAAEERSDMERELRRLRAALKDAGGAPEGADDDTERENDLPVSFNAANASADSLRDEGRLACVSEEEFSRIVSELARAKISMAELQEERIKLKHDLYKQKEKYMAVASKMTKLETRLYR